MDNARQRMEDEGIEVTWVVFRTNFLEKYFPEDNTVRRISSFLD